MLKLNIEVRKVEVLGIFENKEKNTKEFEKLNPTAFYCI